MILLENLTYIRGEKIYFKGKVIQTTNSDTYDKEAVILRVNVTRGEHDIWEDTIYVEYTYKSKNEEKILEDDIIDLYGEFIGEKSYISVIGAKITLPYINAKYINLVTD